MSGKLEEQLMFWCLSTTKTHNRKSLWKDWKTKRQLHSADMDKDSRLNQSTANVDLVGIH